MKWEIGYVELVKNKKQRVLVAKATRWLGIYVVVYNILKQECESIVLFNTNDSNIKDKDCLSLKYKLEKYLLNKDNIYKILKFKKYESIEHEILTEIQSIFNKNKEFLLKLDKIRNNDYTKKLIKDI